MHPDHDSKYLRFLLRLGDKRVPGQTLFEAFEVLLADFGILLEEDSASGIGTRNDTSGEDRLTLRNSTVSYGPSRRGSFSSATQAVNAGYNRRRSTSRASLSQLETTTRTIPENRPSTRATTRPTERVQPTNASRNLDSSLITSGRLTGLQFAKNLQDHNERRASTSNDGRYEASKYSSARHGLVTESLGSNYLSDAESSQELIDDTQRQESHDIRTHHGVTPSEKLIYVSETQLVRDANLFHKICAQSITRKTFQRWRKVAQEVSANHQIIMKKATARDIDVLRSQTFEKWRVVYLNKRHIIETERFFDHLERKAIRARSIYLLTKAFTHWAECASDEVRRTSLARRHILRTKYFNAWKEITVVNDLKVRRQGLRKVFSLWKSRSNVTLVSNDQAVAIYYGNLVKSIYLRWFWNFCEIRAPEWKAARLKRQLFLHWRSKLLNGSQRDTRVNLSFEAGLQRRCLERWLNKAENSLTLTRQADFSRHRKLSAKYLLAWRLECKHLPLARRVSSMVDWRVAYSVFSVFVQRYTIEHRAEEVSRQRIVRNSWTQWNDKLRCQTLANQIDDRVLVQALYKWVLAERFVLLQRLAEKRLLQRHLYILAGRWDYLTHRHSCNEKIGGDGRKGGHLSFAMKKWRSRLDLYRQREQLAHAYNAPRVRQNTLRLWNTRNEHLQKLDNWAKNASFYFRTSRTFKLWQDAVAGSRKQKRRHAYTQIRRQVKVNMARRVIEHWRDQTSRVIGMKQTSNTICQQRLLTFGTAIFDQWRERLTALMDRSHDVEKQYKVNLIKQSLRNWTNEFRERQERSEVSDHYARLYVFKVAHDCFRSLQHNVFELGSREKVATSVNTRNEKRHCHNLFHAWHIKTAQKRGLPSRLEFPPTTRSRRFAPPQRVYGAVPFRDPEGWPTSDDDLDSNDKIPALDATQTTPLPGYLNTPSKRAARARALVRLPLATPAQVKLPPTTPANPSGGLDTSFQRRLRGQKATDPGGASLSRRGSELGQSFGAKVGGDGIVGFDDLPDGSRTGSSTLGTS